ncbi:MAG: hypothetical protein GXX85_03945 [Ignavibacteria bacterium]|nr:hypothetical protein [Ignavibacteria bacterium]
MKYEKNRKILEHIERSIPGFKDTGFVKESLNILQSCRSFNSQIYSVSARILRFILLKKE